MGRRKRLIGLAAGVASALALVAAAPNALAFTMGSNLGREPDVSFQSTGGLITVFNPILSAGLRVGGDPPTYFSPVNGTLVRWRIRTGDTDTGPVALRIIRGTPSFSVSVPRTGAGTSPTVTPELGAISTYEANMRIRSGDAIGIDCCWPDFGQFFADSPGSAEVAIWGDPPLADGGPARVGDDFDFVELAVNADVEPDSAFTISSVKQVRKHRLRVSASFPNPGTLVVGDPKDPNVGSAIPTPPRPGLLFRAHSSGFDRAPYATSVLLSPTKRARKRLRARGALSGKIKLAYTPAYGSVVTQTTRFRLKQ